MKKAAGTDICIYLEIHAHVYQMMFTNVLTSFPVSQRCYYFFSVLSTYCCSNTATVNKLNWSFTIKFLVKIATK